jgi:hypothetical protein
MSQAKYAALWAKAEKAGAAAAAAKVPVPIVVGEAKSLWSDEIDYSKPTYYIPQGLCGFAWVSFPGTSGWARWAKKAGIASAAYGGGYQIWAGRVGGQSVEIKEAWAQAIAEVLSEAGIKASWGSRLD